MPFFAFFIINLLGSSCLSFMIHKGMLFLVVNPSALREVLSLLKSHTWFQFTQLSDLTVVDFFIKSNRFVFVYQLLSLRFGFRLVILLTPEKQAILPAASKNRAVVSKFSVQSVTDIHPASNWYEREAFDMFGVYFSNHPNLRRILTDYGFEGFPLRKDFPLTGFTEVRFDLEKERVVCEPVELPQDFRSFRFNLSPSWTTFKFF